ncbi:glutamate-tRna ligase [Cardiosporidium cionae]|uniref:glutamate--tRNA ligase n=1 Tax=Cardiosporidium cionae TaxID=476202 RepID=A0ABQ7J9A9_9APIC|nr:glutamate-tRna ligase [Cardiosporidium cionae]|eukprot:KAF8820584.1 glutamate-tRna ligase [Cardiosporidium cionae]
MESITLKYNPQTPPVVTLAVAHFYDAACAKLGTFTFGRLSIIPDASLTPNQVTVQTASSSGTKPKDDHASALQLASLTDSLLHLCGRSLHAPLSSLSGNVNVAAVETETYSPHSLSEWLKITHTLYCNDVEETEAFPSSIKPLLTWLNAYLALRMYLLTYRLTLADIAMYVALKRYTPSLHGCSTTTFPTEWTKIFPHVGRWYNHLQEKMTFTASTLLQTQASDALSSLSPEKNKVSRKKDSGRQEKSRDVSSTEVSAYTGKLVGAEKGKVVTRFPPEPSGYLHIGHAKAALLNRYYATLYEGKMIIRFDDTNPAKEKMEFEESIMEDLKMLEVFPDSVTHTSDYFDILQAKLETLLNEGKVYIDNTPMEQMRMDRGEGIESKNRSNSIEENIALWKHMQAGDETGKHCCARAKIDMQDTNKCMRDPVFYRCVVDIPHHKHGFRYKVYPTYDFACPIVDSLEGVTHAMRTNEYSDRIVQYKWATHLPDIFIYEFSRLNFVKTVLSKRKLKWFVDNQLVEGWDDPRFPTVRGILRRGLTVKALLSFLLEQGPSKSGNLMEWDKLWTLNKQLLDPVVPRYMAIAEMAVLVRLRDGPKEVEFGMRNLHPKDASMGQVPISYYYEILIELDDAIQCHEGEEVTLMRWGNAIFEKIVREDGKILLIEGCLHLEGDFKKTKTKLHWLSNLPSKLTKCILKEYDHLITVDKIDKETQNWEEMINPTTEFDTIAWVDPLLDALPCGQRLQLERRGYFRLDKPAKYSDGKLLEMAVLIKIPDGRSKAMSRVSTKVDAAQNIGKKK